MKGKMKKKITEAQTEWDLSVLIALAQAVLLALILVVLLALASREPSPSRPAFTPLTTPAASSSTNLKAGQTTMVFCPEGYVPEPRLTQFQSSLQVQCVMSRPDPAAGIKNEVESAVTPNP